MKKVKIALIIIPFVFVILLLISFQIYIKNSSNIIEKDKYFESVKKPDHHFVVIAQSTDDPFWGAVKKGAFGAAKDLNVAVEFNGPRFTNMDEELQFLNIAIASNVDGIAVHVLDEVSFTPVIDRAVTYGIPVITIENDAGKSKRASYIGSNDFQLGQVGGKLMNEAITGKVKGAIILNTFSESSGNVAQNIKITGFRDAFKESPDKLEIKTIRFSRMGILTAGEITSEIISNYPDINAIFCTNAQDTLGAAQVVVDLNKVGDIAIVGYGDLPEIGRYVENGVLYGTVVSDPVNMGYESIKALVELKKNRAISSYVDTGVYGVTKKNLADYIKNAY